MKKRLADFVADFLVENGITQQFSVTGGGAMFLNDAFGHKQGLKCVYNHHEQASAIAAEGYARATGKVCSVCVTTGPGGTNTLTGVMGAWVDSIPMFVISGQVKFVTTIASCPNLNLRQLGDQEFNIVDCVKTMTKYAVMVTDPNTIKYHLKKALFLATNGRRGPVWLDIPINVQSAQIEVDDLIDYDEKEDCGEIPKQIDNEQLSLLVEKLQSAKRPVILAGEGIRMAGAVESFHKLCDKIGIPVVTAWNAQDVIEDSHFTNCGRQGSMGTRGANYIFQYADFVLSLGCRMNIRQVTYNFGSFAKNAYLAAVDIDQAELDKPTVNVDLKICADAKGVINRLIDEVKPQKQHFEWMKKAKIIDEKYPIVEKRYYDVVSPINPYIFLQKLSETLSEGDTIVTSNGTACVVTCQAFKVKKGQRLFTNSGCASMGYGLPAAIGASCGLNNKPIVCLEGDGSIQMNIQELQTLVHNKLNIKLFWFNNEGYHSIRQTQTCQFKANYCGVSADNGISFPSAEKIAYAYDLPYKKIASIDEIEPTIKEIMQSDSAVLCEVLLDKRQFFEPKLAALRRADGSVYSPSLEDMSPFLGDDEKKEIEAILLKKD